MKRDVWSRYKFPLLFISPALLGLILLHLFPMFQGFWLSLLESNKSTIEQYLHAPFVGLANYREILFSSDSQIRQGLWDALRNTVLYTVFVVFGTIVLGIGGALLVHRNFPGRSVARTLMLFSWIIPSYVVGMLWGFMWQQEEGIVNQLLFDRMHLDIITTWFGVHWDYDTLGQLIKPRWLTGENTLWAIIIPTIWRFWPFAMVMFLAGLSSIPSEVYEAAEMDGASKSEQFFQITLPLLRPVLAMIVLQGIISNVYSFNIVSMMFGNGAGFPGKYGDLLMPNIFRNSFQMWNFGVGAAISTLLMLVMVGVVALWYRRFREDLSNE
ncbi:MAG TPA: sugar ABC transporter permease [Fibrobacteraceae bacterium]|nr:sugar ABC transporter permease [Fibrobacteraceae bacterium]